MRREIVLTGILKDNDMFLVVKRSENDTKYPGAWEFPGGHLEDGESFKDGLKRELKEEIGFESEFNPTIINYCDEIDKNELIHNIELDFVINVNKDNVNIVLSNEHTEYRWVDKTSELLDEYIKSKFDNI